MGSRIFSPLRERAVNRVHFFGAILSSAHSAAVRTSADESQQAVFRYRMNAGSK